MTLSLTYDPFGRRIEKKVSDAGVTTTTRYFYDQEDILFEYDDTGAVGNRYTHGPGIDEPLMLATDKGSYYYHADGLGSITALTDSGGKVGQSYEYDSFGNLNEQRNRIKQPYSYTGRERDEEAGFYYYRARYYDPMEGRFISKDPIGFGGGDVNLYVYVKSTLTNLVDPSGLEPPPNIPPGISIPANVEEAKNMTLIQFYNAVKSRGKWDYKTLDREIFQEFGNYHYGVVGAANGRSTEVLLRAAGAYQIYSRTSADIWGWPWGNSPYGDDPDDQKWILEGIKDYKAGRYGNGCSGGW